MTTKPLDLLDGIFVGDDRMWVSTAQWDPELRLFQTITYGPGARAGDQRLYNTEELAREGHAEMLASYGYRKTGLRRWKFFRQLEFFGKGMVNVSRRPVSRKSVWIMTGFWVFAVLCATTSVITSGGGWSLWTGLAIGALDLYMLYQCITGLLWSYNIPRKGRRRKVVP